MSRRFAIIAMAAMLASLCVHARIERVWLSLRRAVPTHITVNWETDSEGDSQVEYGPTEACGQRVSGLFDGTFYRVDIPYPEGGPLYYRVRAGTDVSPTACCPPLTGAVLRIAVIGNASALRPMPGLVDDAPQMLMTAGDNVGRLWTGQTRNDPGNVAPYRKLIDTHQDLLRTTIFLPALGNHDREILPRGPKRYPDEPTYDPDATAFRRFFELPGDEWKWQIRLPRFGVRIAALDLNHTSDMGSTWQTCHPFDPDSDQFQWFDRLTRMAEEPYVIALQNEQNNMMRHRQGWGELFARCNLVATGYGYYAEFAEDGPTAFYNTSVNGHGTPYKDGKSKFLVSENSYLLLTFRPGSPLTAQLKTLDGDVLFERTHAPRPRGRAALAAGGRKPDVVVAPDGDDRAAGTSAAPFRTLRRARDAVRTLRRSKPDLDRPVVIEIRGGIHRLETPLELSAEDSGTEKSPTVYRAADGETVVLSGGQKLAGWQVLDNGHWRAPLPEDAPADWMFSQLWVNGKRRYRPRLPKTSYYAVDTKAEPSPEAPEGRYDRFRFHEGDIVPEWAGTNTEILLPRRWWMSRFRIREVDPALRQVTLAGAVWGGPGYSWTRPERGDRYLVVNAPDSLSEPGEWQLDTGNRWVTYVPMPGEAPDTAEIVAPRLRHLVRFSCGNEPDSGVRHVRFKGLRFAHSNWNLPLEGYTFPQAEVILSGAVTAEGARHCAFIGCSVEHTGEYAFDLGAGCRDVQIENCELTDLGAGGVLIGTKTGGHMGAAAPNRTGSEWVPTHITVRDCLIAHGGRLHMAGVGVGITHANRCLIDHNSILDFTYTGVTVGWNWGFGHSDSHHNVVSNNHIHHIGQGVLSDLGGIYTLGVSPGTALLGNRIHDIDRLKYGGWGIYHDSGSSHILSRNNLVYDTRDGAFMQGRGRDNRQINNIFAFGDEAQLSLYNSTEDAAATLERNIILWTDATLLSRPWINGKHRMNANLYYRTDQPATFAEKSLDQWRAETGQDIDSIVADPQFVDPQHGDFHLKPSSPAFAVGFRPFDYTDTGRRTGADPARQTWPERAWPTGSATPKPRPFQTGFEGLEPGTQPLLPDCYQDNDTYRITVTDAVAAEGSNSLAFRDGPTEHSWNPHLVYQTNWSSGRLRCEFSVRLQAGARLTHEWRTSMPPFVAAGPHLDTDEEGRLLLPGRDPVQLPLNQWIRFSVTCPLGDTPGRTWSLDVHLPDGTRNTYNDLSLPDAFDRLGWIGFIAAGTQEASFNLDNVSLKPVGD